MKTRKNFMKIAAVLICTTISIHLFSQTEDTDVSIYAFRSEPVVDGIIEEGWNDNEYLMIEHVSEELSTRTEIVEDDYLPKFKMSWYGNKLYFLMVVNDDYLYNVGEYSYMNDGYSLNLDLGHEFSSELDYNDFNLVMDWGKPKASFIWTPDPEIQAADIYDMIEFAEVIDEDNGLFIAEISFDVNDFNMPQPLAEGVAFGLDIEAIDRDGVDNPDTFGRDQTLFWYSDGDSWNDRSVVGSVGLGSVGLKSAITSVNTSKLTSKNELEIYPQPSKDFITVKADKNLTNIEIYNVIGERIFSRNVNSKNPNIDISELADGCFFISAFTEKGLYCTKKFIVQ